MKSKVTKLLSLLAGLLGLSIAVKNKSAVDKYLQDAMGAKFQKTTIKEIYFAGPNSTVRCE